MLWRTYQFLLAFGGGSYAIYTGLESGPGIGFVGACTAFAGSWLAVRAGELWRRAQQSNRPTLAQRKLTRP